MSDDSKIISLSDRARLRKGGRPSASRAPPRRGGPAGPVNGDAAAEGNAAGETGGKAPAMGPTGPVPSQLVWLYCPTCETLEYTELVLPQGRVHQTCGTRVEEVTVDVDARAEYSLAELNLRQLERLAELVDGQRARFREYQHRVELAARQPLSSYPLTEDTVRVMPVAEVDPLGLLISAFLRQPLQRFRPDTAKPDSGKTEPGKSDAGKPDAGTSGSDSSRPPAGGAPSAGGVPPAGDEPSR